MKGAKAKINLTSAKKWPMVSGNGMVASEFLSKYSSNNNYVILASGVSNSKCTDPAAYQREWQTIETLLDRHPSSHFIYFSTCSIEDPGEKSSMYTESKLKIEKLISDKAEKYHIFRITNLVGKSSNRNTIVNYLYYKIKHKEPFILWSRAERNLLDTKDMYRIIDYILENNLFCNEITNIANNRNYSIQYIVSEIEKFCGTNAIKTEISKGESYKVNTAKIEPVLRKIGISFPADYFPSLLKKYYSGT